MPSSNEVKSSLHALSKFSPPADLFLYQRKCTLPRFRLSSRKLPLYFHSFCSFLHSSHFTHSLLRDFISLIFSPIFSLILLHTSYFSFCTYARSRELVHFTHYILLFLHFSLSLFAAVPTSFPRKPSLHLTHLVSVLSRYTRACTLLSRALIFISLSIITYPEHTHTQTHSYLASCSLSSILSLPRSLSPRGTVFFCAVRTSLVWCSGTDPRTFWVPTKSSHWYSCLSWKSPSFSRF